jgi:hypothetical protein
MKRLLILFVLPLLFASSVQGQANNNAPYAIYLVAKKELSLLEWRLVQVNLKLGNTGYFIHFDIKSDIFEVQKFIDTYTLETTAPNVLRELLLSQCGLVKATIGSEFPEFRERDSKDLSIKFIIGEASARHFASYSSGSFSFADGYYSFRKERGK